jgi:hypothetical protein
VAGLSIQVPSGWGREVGGPRSFAQLLDAGSGNTGLAVFAAPPESPGLEDAVDAVMADPYFADWQPFGRVDLMHGTHRAVRLDSRNAPFVGPGGQILYLVERPDRPPVMVTLAWDSVPDLGYVEEAILRSFNPDGTGPVILTWDPVGSSAGIRMSADGCSVGGPQIALDTESRGLVVANETAHTAALALLRVGRDYNNLVTTVTFADQKLTTGTDPTLDSPWFDAVMAAAEAMASGQNPNWETADTPGDTPLAAGGSWISQVSLEALGTGTLTADGPDTYGVLCVPVSEEREPLGVHLTMPFEVTQEGS